VNKTSSCIGLVLAANLLVACGSSDSVEKTAPTCISPADPSCRIAVEAPSVVRWVAPATDAVSGGVSTAVVERTSDGTCLSGKVDPGPGGTGWGALVIFELARTDDSVTVLAPFDLKAKGVTKVRFNLSNPPSTGVLPQLVELSSADCTTTPGCLSVFDGPPPVTTAGSVTLALGDFVTAEAQDTNKVSDPTISTAFQLLVAPSSGTVVDYDFCIQNLQFLDAAGKEVSR